MIHPGKYHKRRLSLKEAKNNVTAEKKDLDNKLRLVMLNIDKAERALKKDNERERKLAINTALRVLSSLTL